VKKKKEKSEISLRFCDHTRMHCVRLKGKKNGKY